jgi:hypothetical protein
MRDTGWIVNSTVPTSVGRKVFFVIMIASVQMIFVVIVFVARVFFSGDI